METIGLIIILLAVLVSPFTFRKIEHNIELFLFVMGLLIAGGMLIPGNIPNIIAASKLKIGMKEWAQFGIPLGLILMSLYFFILK